MRTWELVRQAIESVLRSRLRSTLTSLGIAIASGALVSMVGFALGMQAQVEAPIKKLGLLNNIEVQRAEPDDENDEIPPKPAPVLDDAILDRFERIPEVEYAYPDFRLSEIQLKHGEKSYSTYAIGLPREATLISFFDDLLVAGEFFSLTTEPEVVLGEQTLEQLGFDSAEAAVGQSVELVAAGLVPGDSDQFEFKRQRLSVRVVGVYRPPSFASELGAGAVLLPVDAMRDLPGTVIERSLQQLRAGDDGVISGFPKVIVRANHPSDVYRVEQEIRKMGFETRAFVTRFKEARTFFLFMQLLLAAVGTVALVVAGLGIMNTLMMAVMERYQEIGVYKAIGASAGDIRILFLTEAAVVGFVGALGGLLLARVVSSIIQHVFNQFAASQGIEGPVAAFRFPLWLLAGAVLYGVTVSIVSGLYPASRAARIDPIQALRRQ